MSTRTPLALKNVSSREAAMYTTNTKFIKARVMRDSVHGQIEFYSIKHETSPDLFIVLLYASSPKTFE